MTEVLTLVPYVWLAVHFSICLGRMRRRALHWTAVPVVLLVALLASGSSICLRIIAIDRPETTLIEGIVVSLSIFAIGAVFAGSLTISDWCKSRLK